MRELERESLTDTPSLGRVAIVGRGRLGCALRDQLQHAGVSVLGPLGRAEVGRCGSGDGPEAVLLCVPDAEIASAAGAVTPGALVGHCSGATGLEVLLPHEGFSIHPLMTVSGRDEPDFAGAGAAVAGSTPRALAYARSLADRLGLVSVEVTAQDRPLYHAAASMASNFLLTLEGAAEQLASLSGVSRELLVPLVRVSIENWASDGAGASLTGPIARGDERTVAAHREAIRERTPELLELYDVLAERTRALAGRETQPA